MNDALTWRTGCPEVVQSDELKTRLVKEAARLAILGFVGLAVLPLCIWFVGRAVFGEYGSGGVISFFGALQRELAAGELAVWFLLLSPYLLWQLFRLTLWGFRRLGRPQGGPGVDARDAPGKL